MRRDTPLNANLPLSANLLRRPSRNARARGPVEHESSTQQNQMARPQYETTEGL